MGIIKTKNSCYAQSLGACNNISGEHYISKCVLDEMNNVEIECDGFPWLQGKTKKIPPSKLVTKVLCSNHNKKLSELDAYTCEFFRTLKKFSSQPHLEEIWLCETRKIERWLIKVYLGMHTGKHLGKNGKLLSSLHHENIEPYLLESLFNDSPLPHPLGAYIFLDLPPVPGASRSIQISNKISITPYTSKEGDIVHAINCNMMGIMPLYLLIRAKSINEGGLRIDRPNECNIYKSKIKFDW